MEKISKHNIYAFDRGYTHSSIQKYYVKFKISAKLKTLHFLY